MLTKWLLLAILGVLPIEVTTTEGEQWRGTYAGMDTSALLITSDGATKSLAYDNLSSVLPVEAPSQTGPIIRVSLSSGSSIAAQSVTMKGESLSIEPRRQDILIVPVQTVRSIRFRGPNPAVDPVWYAKLEENRRSDTLAIRREGDRLDFVEGVITSIVSETVSIEIDGDPIEAPISRLEGVVFGGAISEEAASDIHIVDCYGSRWSASAIEPSTATDPLPIQLYGSIRHTIPMDQIESIRFTGGIAMLASMTPATKTYRETIQTKLDSALLEAWLSPHCESDQDLVMWGDSSIEYRVDEGYKVFAAGVHRDPSVRTASKATVRILIDEHVAWEKTFAADDVGGFELPLEGAQRLRIEVDSGDDGDLGDTFRFSRPRLLR